MAIGLAFTVTFVWPKRNGLDIDIDASARAKAAKEKRPYDLSKLTVLSRAVLEIKDHYVEPERAVPTKMLLSGLNAIQRAAAPVIVHYRNGAQSFRVQVNGEQRTFSLKDVSSPWSITGRFEQVFKFLQTNLKREDIELQDVEYAAVNGILKTLDPHSVLLTPDIFEEMRMNTRGEFGGLGIVISIRDGHLTVIRPMKNTPAARAGLKEGDRIVKINDESTLNMPLTEAVNRLRGAPGSKVVTWIVRPKAFNTPKRVQLTRAVIHIDSVESRMLKGNVGFVKIKNFQRQTHEELRRALAKLRRQAMRGLILDLRDNPGGLLDQAVRVSDTFLSSGTIVTTSSNDPSQRDDKEAHEEDTEPNYPMVVLVNGSSASASEIVSGALKAHDRALIVGQRTFGKGSVQVLYEFQDHSALKLTVAQYLTPGDISIQGVGIVPDIAIDPMTIDKEDMDLAVDMHQLRESDLRAALTSNRTSQSQKPVTVLRYFLPKGTRQKLRDAQPEDGKENAEENEFLLEFGRRILAQTDARGRRELLSGAKNIIAAVAETEMKEASDALRKLGVDWTDGTPNKPAQITSEVTTNAKSNTVRAGEPLALTVKVKNVGDEPIYRLRAETKSDFQLFDSRELVFGKLKPGQSASWTTTLGVCERKGTARSCFIPKHLSSRADGIRVTFRDSRGDVKHEGVVRTKILALPTPRFSYSWFVDDDPDQSDRDGFIEKGERANIFLRVKNDGPGESLETFANLRNMGGRGVILYAGRFDLGRMKPNDERVVKFNLGVLKDFDQLAAKVQVSLGDRVLRESVSEKISVKVYPPKRRKVVEETRTLRLPVGTSIYEAPSGNPVATVVDGPLVVTSTAHDGKRDHIQLEDGITAWVDSNPAQLSQRGASKGSLSWTLDHQPPQLRVDYGEHLVTRSATLPIRGLASHPEHLRDVYIFVGGRKVFYSSTDGFKSSKSLKLDVPLPLAPGLNYVAVIARQGTDVASQVTFVVRRDGPKGELLETPDHDDDVFSLFHHGD